MCENFHLSFPVIFLFSRAIFRRHKNLNCWQKSFSRTMIQVYSEAYLRLSGRSGTSLGRARSAEPCLSQEVIQIYVPPKKADSFLLAPILFAWQRLCYLMFVTGRSIFKINKLSMSHFKFWPRRELSFFCL